MSVLKSSLKVLSFILTLFVFIYPPLVIIAQPAVPVSIAADVPQLGAIQIQPQPGGKVLVDVGDFPQGGRPGDPALPYKLVSLLVPPDTDLSAVQANLVSGDWQELDGEHDVSPVPPAATWDGEKFVVDWSGKNEIDIVDGQDSAVYSQDAFFPAEPVEIVSVGEFRQWKLVEYKVWLASYNPAQKKLRVLNNAQTELSVPKLSVAPVIESTSSDAFVPELLNKIDNSEDLDTFYGGGEEGASRTLDGAPGSIPADYVIITTNTIVTNSTKLANFIIAKQALGFTVKTVTESAAGADDTHYISGASCDARADNIRSWLKSYWASDGIKYVLLIGNPHPSTFSSTTSIPMKMCWPRSGQSSYQTAPSDMYFAELSNTWDLDVDGKYGEYNGDYGAGGCDNSCEVKLGRIPFYGSYVDLDSILQKSINYGSATGNLAWRKKVLIPAAVSNFGPQDNNGDGDASDAGDYPNSSYRTFGADWGEAVKSFATSNSYSPYTLYEKNGVYNDGSAYPLTACNAALTNANFIAEWQKAYGFVTWWGHGGQPSASRFRWWPNDTIFVNIMGNSGAHYEATWTTFVSTADCASLDDTKPSFVVQVSCLNGYPENSGNLGYSLLKQGAIATVSGTRVTWYKIGAWYTSDGGTYGDNASYGYHCFNRMAGSNETIGEALVYCKANFNPTNWTSGSSWMNMVDLSLYGDPSLGLGVVGGGPKWEQLPDKTENGMDLRIDREDGFARVLADDFRCTQTGAITDIVFWGSWLNDKKCPIKKIHLSIHDDKPDPDGQGPMYSEPNTLLWSRDFVASDINETLYHVGPSTPEWFWDPAGGMAPISAADTMIWQYHIHIGSNQFIQQGDPCDPLVYWLDIYAELDKPPGDQNDYQFGWKTSKDHWNDDGVWSSDDGMMWNELRYPFGHEYYDDSIDLSFRISTGEANEPNYVKWSQPPVPWEEEGIYVGWDEEAHDRMNPPTMVADDFLCDSNKPVTGIRWWGSFLNWQSPTVPPPNSLPDKFLLTIWTDTPNNVDATYSHPNEVIWGNMCDTYTVDFYGYEYDPRIGTQTLPKFEFYQELDPCDYWQQPNDVGVYWLGIMAIYGDIPGEPCYPWGWETREHYYNDDAVRFTGGIPDMCTPYLPEDFEPIEWQGDSWDVSFELITNPKVPPKPATPNLKWSQPPIEIDPTASAPTYLGWDEKSYNKDVELHPTEPWRIVADDFRCLGNIPITSIHWWGSYFDWEEPVSMPLVQPIKWHIGFWSNVPAGVATDYSYPEVLLHQFTVDANRVEIEQVATDYYHGEYPNDVCYQYYVDLEENEVFWQADYNDQTQDHVYWLSITAVYDDACAPPDEPWGWKTRPWSWMDDAVIFNISEMPVDGMQLDPLSITPIKDPVFYESFDVTFELDTDPNYIKWQQPYDSIRHWSHYEDEKSMAITETETTDPVTKWIQNPDLSMNGMDVNATEPYILADDYQCTQTGPITDITVWGSWRNDYLPFENDENAVTFVLSIHSDNPVGPMGWSEPEEPLWIKAFMQGEFTATPITTQGEGWYDPNEDMYIFPGDFTCWRYDFHIDASEAFVQQGTTTNEIIYWLDVQAIPQDENAKFGWKTSDTHWHDDAVWGWAHETDPNLGDGGVPSIQPYYGPWYELRYPPDHAFADQSIDLAFEIKGSEQTSEEPNIIRLVADDWKCSGQTPVTAVVWWGSYINYGYEPSNITGPWMPLPVKPDYFLLNIWDDVPASASSTGYSHPNDVLWQYKAYAYDEVMVGYDKMPHGDPNEPVFRYSVRLPEDNWFCQKEVNDIYWLSVVAVYEQSIPNYDWGWTNHEHVFNDDAVAGTRVGGPAPTWQWEELYDQTQQSEDMSFMLFTEPGCFPCCHPDYNIWRSVGKPACWCYPSQCYGDLDNAVTGDAKQGYIKVSAPDLTIFMSGWGIVDPPQGPGLTGNQICGDLGHDVTGDPKQGYTRVSAPDLTIFMNWWDVKEPPQGPGVPADCLDCP